MALSESFRTSPKSTSETVASRMAAEQPILYDSCDQ